MLNDTENELTYQNMTDEHIGEGSFGKVYKIKKIPVNPEDTEYVFKMKNAKKTNKSFPIIIEGERSNLLDDENLLDKDSRVIFQGKI